jgi:hypothetical protein
MPHMNFTKTEKPRGRKTERWEVSSVIGDCFLGYVSWRNGWRRYVFEPARETVFDAACLADLTKFVSIQTEVQQEVQKAKRGV